MPIDTTAAASSVVVKPFRVPRPALQLHPHATVVVDTAAAAELQLVGYYRETWAAKPAWQAL